ncbi:MAG: hypothetical protein ACW97V_18115 [Promethearchaeota archaeon]|jgi:hypothetical protein
MSRNLKYIPQSGTYMDEAVKEAIKIAQALSDAGLYAFMMISYNDISIGINELSDPGAVLERLKGKIKNKYERQTNSDE